MEVAARVLQAWLQEHVARALVCGSIREAGQRLSRCFPAGGMLSVVVGLAGVLLPGIS